MNLPPLIQAFVLHFGEMGSRWGINRTVGQIYALLYVSPEPLCADEIVEKLGISRSNVSMSLRELQAWNLALPRHRPDDRRDFFTTPDDVWQILRTLAEERKKREVDPTLSVLREILLEEPGSEAERHAQARMAQMHGLIEQLTTWYDDVKRLETDRLAQLLRLGARITRILETKDALLSLGRGRRKASAATEHE
ncbi:GbsR/MarR family transcriptional regulator [Ancylobacter sp. 6x-1]|uniref:HTH-type transcriptional regulator n=1 Tax=Ancylobacter crimeensis TaxID=2579147 RepID=A0ABT0DB26_9HYPH|nr:GbsR/MarR family transcriptional regulator [Ancylobacter crimeensis]